MSKELYLGLNEAERPVRISDCARSMHTQIIGATGVGKTESAILPILLSDLVSQRSIIFIDPKGDRDTYEALRTLCSWTERSNDLLKIDLAASNTSALYNPLKIGSPTELKDKIVGSIIWTEEYYKKVAERTLLDIFNLFQRLNQNVTLKDLAHLLTHPKTFQLSKELLSDDETAAWSHLVQNILADRKDLSGVVADLKLWGESEFSKIIAKCDAPSVFDWINEKKVIYINLNTLAFEESARRFGRLIIQDIKTAVQRLQGMPSTSRPSTSVVIDEFAAVASSGFIELLNKARSANVRLTLAHQSQGDLTAISPSFANQVIDNTNLKMIFRLDSPETSDFYSRLIGTKASEKETVQINNGGLLGTNKTGMGSMRLTEEFIVSPNQLRSLKRGECIVLSKIPHEVHKCRLKPVAKWINEFETNEIKRRAKWPMYGKAVSH